MSASERLRSARMRAGYSTGTDAARGMGVNEVTYASHENGVRGLRADIAARYARFFHVPVEWLQFGSGEAPVNRVVETAPARTPRQSPNVSIAAERASLGRHSIPVYGLAAGGPDGRFILNGQKIADVICPPSLEYVPDAYAVQFHGTSMEPRYYAGEIGWVNPRAAIRSGDFVVVQLRPDEDGEPPYGYVKRFVRRASEVTLEQLNPPEGEDRLLSFPVEDVISIHKVVMAGQG